MEFKKFNKQREQKCIEKLSSMLKDYTFINTCDYNDYAFNEEGFCSVDFVLMKDNKFICYLEVRTRNNIDSYDSLFIGYNKIESISNHYNDTIIIWFDANNLDNVYYVCFDKKLLNCCISNRAIGKLTREIPKNIMSKGLVNLCNLLCEYQ